RLHGQWRRRRRVQADRRRHQDCRAGARAVRSALRYADVRSAQQSPDDRRQGAQAGAAAGQEVITVTSVPAGPHGPAEDAEWSWGMAMSRKEKLLFVWLLAVVAVSFVFHYFWACTMSALGKAVALNLVLLPGLVKLATGICAAQLLSR